MRRPVPLALLCSLLLVVAAVPPITSARTSSASLRIVMLSNGSVALRGAHWTPRTPVIITASAFDSLGGLRLRSTAAGSFMVVVHNARACDAVVAHAYDLRGHARTARRNTMGCSPTPRPIHMSADLAVRQGTMLPAPIVRRLGGTDGEAITMRVGEVLYLWEPGTVRPAYTAHADGSFLALYRQGTPPPRLCPQPDCGSGFYWEWIALRPGETGIDLAAACREVTPPCMLPDRLYRVSIVPTDSKTPLSP